MRQRVQKIKSLAKQQLESMSENDPGASASANGATPKSGGKRKNGAAATSGEDDEQSGEKSPVKKAKSATKNPRPCLETLPIILHPITRTFLSS